MLYQHQEHGVDMGSELFLVTPSKLAESLLFCLHRCGRFICNKDYRIVRENFNNYLIFCVDQGSMHIENESRSYTAHKGDIGIINCHMPHAYIALESNTIFTWFHFSGATTQKIYEHILERHSAVFHVSSSSGVWKKIHELVDLLRTQENSAEEIVIEDRITKQIYDILISMLFIAKETGHTVNPSRNPVIEQSIRYIREHYMEPMEINDVADSVSVSRFHFSRMFKSEVGYTPHEYLVLFRINRAKELLKSTDYSISEIASMVGYEYSTSFTSVFQRKIGVTPKKYRDMPL